MKKTTTSLQCTCGQVRLTVDKAPITSVECCCDSCRAAAARLSQLEGLPPIVNAHGGTPFVLYRKDRIAFITGADLLREFRLTPDGKTRRVIAGCCNTAVFLEFENGHWLSLYAGLWPNSTLPRLEMRTMTKDLPPNTTLPQDVPNAKRQSLSFFAKLLGAWIAMGFKSPKVAVNGVVQV